jgi:hypothetical protein
LAKKNFKIQEYFSKEKLLYNLSARTLEKKTYFPSSYLLIISKKITVILPNLAEFKRLEGLNVNLIHKGYFKLLHYLYYFINEPTFFKKMILFINLVRLDIHSTNFNPLTTSYFFDSSAKNNFLLSHKAILTYQTGIKGLVFNDIEKTKSINGICLERFSYKGMGRDKYR